MAINKLFRLLKSEQGKGFLNNFAVAAIFAGIGELASQQKEERTIEKDNTTLMALKDLSLTTADIVRHVRQSEERILNKNQPLKILGGADHLEAQKRLKALAKSLLADETIPKASLDRILPSYGVEKFTPQVGDSFDSNKHRIDHFVIKANHNLNMIVHVNQAGYLFEGEVIRRLIMM
nr:uncharacterized protein LOC113735323 [Coffea arabica]